MGKDYRGVVPLCRVWVKLWFMVPPWYGEWGRGPEAEGRRNPGP